MKLGYLGPQGSYSYEVACQYLAKAAVEAELIALSDFSAIIEGVETRQLALGILPVENSTHGAVITAMDLMLSLSSSSVIGEAVLEINHCLLSKGSRIADLKQVYSHEHALEQCHQFFCKRYPQIELIRTTSTSRACELAEKYGSDYGAVASSVAASLYALPILEYNIQDNSHNQTRFLIIGAQAVKPTGRDKTSIAFAFFGDYPGSLYNIMKIFAERDINLTRVESRPAKQNLGKYVFYIDFAGHLEEEKIADSLIAINKQVCWLKIFGSYPADNVI